MCFARTSLREHISDVHHAHVITGFGRVVANKAGAAVGPIACTLSAHVITGFGRVVANKAGAAVRCACMHEYMSIYT